MILMLIYNFLEWSYWKAFPYFPTQYILLGLRKMVERQNILKNY